MRVVIANYGRPVPSNLDYASYWSGHEKPPRGPRMSLFEYKADWGFHIFSIGVYLMDVGVAEEVEFWDCGPHRRMSHHPQGVLKVMFHNEEDMLAYLSRYGYPDLYIQYGGFGGRTILQALAGKCFRVFVPSLRIGIDRRGNFNADCYLVDDKRFLDNRSMMYIPVVNTAKIKAGNRPKRWDYIYLSEVRGNKRHDILLSAVRKTVMTGHLHPVDKGQLDLTGMQITTTGWDEADVVALLQSSRIAVYPGDRTSSPAAMWECVAAGLPIVVNRKIAGGRHVVVPGVTGELAPPRMFGKVMKKVIANADAYRPREYLDKHWDTVTLLEDYLAFFRRMGWNH